MEERIEKGSLVNVYFERCDAIYDAIVLYTPCATGDCFTLKTPDGTIYNVQNYNVMQKIKPQQTNKEE